MVTTAPGRENRPLAFSLDVPQLRKEAGAFQLLSFRQPTELDEGRVDIEQAYRLLAASAGHCLARRNNNERTARRLLPEGKFFPVLLFAKVKSMI